jgi:hypothetical protein
MAREHPSGDIAALTRKVVDERAERSARLVPNGGQRSVVIGPMLTKEISS